MLSYFLNPASVVQMATQQPVIPPVAVEEFICAGNGLLYEGHPRESPAELRLLLLPQGDKNGISDRDRKVYTISCIVYSTDIFFVPVYFMPLPRVNMCSRV
jgi:hypothetical protein